MEENFVHLGKSEEKGRGRRNGLPKTLFTLISHQLILITVPKTNKLEKKNVLPISFVDNKNVVHNGVEIRIAMMKTGVEIRIAMMKTFNCNVNGDIQVSSKEIKKIGVRIRKSQHQPSWFYRNCQSSIAEVVAAN